MVTQVHNEITPAEAAELSKFDAALIRKYCNEGKFDCERRGPRMWLIDRQSFLAFAKQKGKPKPGNPKHARVTERRKAQLEMYLAKLTPPMRRRIKAGEIRVTVANLKGLARLGNNRARWVLFEKMAARRGR